MASAPSLADAMEAYLARPKLSSQAHEDDLRSQLDKHLKDWMGLPLHEFSKNLVVGRHRPLAPTPASANHLLKYFRTFWNYARRTGNLAECPTMAIEGSEKAGERDIITDIRV
jgi:hypothetical protein